MANLRHHRPLSPPRPGCCAARSRLRHRARPTSALGILSRNAAVLAPERSKKTSSDISAKHSMFVASLTFAPATDRWHSRAKRSIEFAPRAITPAQGAHAPQKGAGTGAGTSPISVSRGDRTWVEARLQSQVISPAGVFVSPGRHVSWLATPGPSKNRPDCYIRRFGWRDRNGEYRARMLGDTVYVYQRPANGEQRLASHDSRGFFHVTGFARAWKSVSVRLARVGAKTEARLINIASK